MDNSSYLCLLALDMLQHNSHRPIKNGKCNRDKIHEAITIGIYNKNIKPISERDVELVCLLIDDLIATKGN